MFLAAIVWAEEGVFAYSHITGLSVLRLESSKILRLSLLIFILTAAIFVLLVSMSRLHILWNARLGSATSVQP